MHISIKKSIYYYSNSLAKIFIEAGDIFPDDITLKKIKNDVILMPCVIKDGNKFYEQLFLGYELYAK